MRRQCMVMSPPRLWPLTACTTTYRPVLSSESPRVEAGKNTSTVIPASRKRQRKGNPVVSDEAVNVCLWVLRDSDHWQLALQITDSSSRQRGLPKQLSGKRKEKKNLVMASKGCPTPRLIGRLTVGHNINSTQVFLVSQGFSPNTRCLYV
jgi:hypothetical protein